MSTAATTKKTATAVRDFCRAHGITEDQFYGREKVGGDLYLGSLTSIPEGFNPTVGGDLYLRSLTSIPEGFNPTVGGDLYLRSLTSIPEGFNPTVGGDLYLGSLTSIPEGFNPTVGGDLYLGSLTSIPEGFNPTVGGDLYLGSLTSIPEGFNPTVGGDLYLGSLTSIPEGFNPTVGGYLDLRSLTSIPEGFNPTVGGDLYLRSLTSIPEGFNPTVGGYLYLGSLTSIPEGFNPTVGGDLYLRSLTSIPEGFNPTVGGYLVWKNGRKNIGNPAARTPRPRPVPQALTWKEGRYIKVDGIFSEVIEQRANIYRTRHIGKKEIEYLITDGNGAWAHGQTLDEAREDLLYKIGNRSLDELRKMDPDEPMSFGKAVGLYRIITGACSAGCRGFVERNGLSKERTYTVAEIIEITKGAYGHPALEKFASSLKRA
jgi:hypothetical protein